MAMTISSRAVHATAQTGTSTGDDWHQRRNLARIRRDACAPWRGGHDVSSMPALERAMRHARTNRLSPSRGTIGAAVIRAAMHSADLTRRALANTLGVSPVIVHGWETGTTPLYRVGYQQLRQLAEALGRTGERTGFDLATLLLASQCDLFVAGMLGGFEDFAEVPPIEHQPEGQVARALLRWALTGDVPERYRPYVQPGPLLTSAIQR